MPWLSSTRRRVREVAERAKQRASWEQMKAAVAAKYERREA